MSNRVLQRCLKGSLLNDNLPPYCQDAIVKVQGSCLDETMNTELNLTKKSVSEGILISGATGTGKTVLARKISQQIRDYYNEQASYIILEVKNDYYDSLYKQGDLILGQASYREQSVKWNLFSDLTHDGWDDYNIKLNCMEFSRQLFSDKKNQAQQFFPDGAQLLLYCVLVEYIRRGRVSLAERAKCTNKGFRDFFVNFDPEQYIDLLEDCEEPGIIRMIMGESADNLQALGVMGEAVLTIVSTFVDVFGEEGDFSIREFVKEKRGRCLFLKYDPSYKETQQRLYGLMVNLIFKEVLSQEQNKGKLVFMCDELPAIGKVDIASAVNLGRAKGLNVCAGIQSIEQLYELHGEHEGNSILAGFKTKVFFSPNDAVTRSFLKECFGKNYVEYISLSAGGSVSEYREQYVVDDYDINTLKAGDCICGLSGEDPFKFHVRL